MLFAGNFCGMAHEARAHHSMLMRLLFLSVGPGPVSMNCYLTNDFAGTEREGF